MIEAPISRQKQTVFLLLSCLLNLLLVLFLATHHINIPDKATLITFIDTPSKTVPDQTQHTPWAARKARSGPLGAPVIMQNPTTLSPSAPTPPTTAQPIQTTSYTNTTQSEQANQEEEQQNRSEAHPPEPPHTQTHPQPIPTAQTMPLEQFKTTVDQAHTEHKPSLDPSNNTEQQKNSPHTAQHKQSATPTPSSLAKQMTLADLTRHFLDHSADTDGTSAVTIIGDKSKMPTQDQLKHERYIEKLTACIHDSCSINRQKQPHIENLPGGSLEIFMALNQNGSIQNIELIRSSGSHHIDAFFMHVFKDASSSFPPVPHYLPHNPYKIAYLVELRMESQNGLRLYRR